MRFSRNGNEFGDLERQLRAGRTQPSERLQRTVGELTSARPESSPRARARLVIAGGLTASLLAAAAVLGASTAAGSQRDLTASASEYEYAELVTICHYPDGQAAGLTLHVSEQGAKHHIAEHSRDHLGPCP